MVGLDRYVGIVVPWIYIFTPFVMRKSCRSRFLLLYLQDVAAVPNAVAARWPLDCHQSAGLFIYGKTYHIHMYESKRIGSNRTYIVDVYIYLRYKFSMSRAQAQLCVRL